MGWPCVKARKPRRNQEESDIGAYIMRPFQISDIAEFYFYYVIKFLVPILAMKMLTELRANSMFCSNSFW